MDQNTSHTTKSKKLRIWSVICHWQNHIEKYDELIHFSNFYSTYKHSGTGIYHDESSYVMPCCWVKSSWTSERPQCPSPLKCQAATKYPVTQHNVPTLQQQHCEKIKSHNKYRKYNYNILITWIYTVILLYSLLRDNLNSSDYTASNIHDYNKSSKCDSRVQICNTSLFKKHMINMGKTLHNTTRCQTEIKNWKTLKCLKQNSNFFYRIIFCIRWMKCQQNSKRQPEINIILWV